jgi:flagellar basal-body rod protein FlgB
VIQGLFDSGSLPVLQRLAQFTQSRHQLLVHDIANLSTPNFRPVDLSVSAFQKSLGEAIDKRRNAAGNDGNPIGPLDDVLDPKVAASNDGILFQDGNNRSLENLMKDLAENTMTHNASMDLIKSEFRSLDIAISGRL